ncbi:Cilia- and flagella-associated protein 57 (WD repeat-containing protein 65) [Durusdinium trenchii]|uniref:Cilia- and flagella-associated protein 57 (WD repeat-containing protein 65) n=1 Tax=Durusdinium trenchii TaxID=1381693 RepID=A0ABP0RHF2_9DINO
MAASVRKTRQETGAQLAHRHVFGFKSGVKGNVHFTDDAHLLYPAGHNTILYHADHKSQIRVFPGSEGSEGISSLALSPNRKFLAVCEKFQERAVCYVYDVTTGKRRRGQLTYGECDAREYVCAAFSAENKLLITQGGPPDWTLILWSWDKAKAHGAVKVSNLTGSMIHECSFNPQDSSLVCIIGDGVFKFFRLQDGTFKGIPNQLNKMREASNQNYICHTWLNDDRLIVCSEAGDALLFDSGGEFKMVLPCSPCEPRSLLCVASFSRGFIAGGEKGVVTFYERSDDAKEMFRKAKEVKLDSSMSGPMMPSVGAVTAMTVSPAEETVAIATGSNQLLTFSLSPTDIMKAEEGNVDFALTSFHTGPIFGLDVCVRKPLVVTCGTDKTVRIWNFVDRTQELCKVFNEEAFSVAFHPSGFHLIVGFADKVRLMNLLMEDFRTYKEIPIKACRETRFSHGGQFFAAVNSNTIQVYKTYTCEVVCNLRGHQSKVKAVCWTSDDFRLVSCGQDGAAYEYDILKEGRRVSEWSQKGTNFASIVSHTDFEAATPATTLYVAGSDKMLKEVRESSLTNYLESNAVLGQLALAPCTQALIAGVAEQELPGSLRCYTFPLTGDYVEYQAHAAPVSRIRITWDEFRGRRSGGSAETRPLYLFSTGDDGCLCIFDIKKNGPPRKDKDFGLGYADEILVTRQFLDEKQATLLEFERRVEELDSRIAFQLRHRDGLHKEKMAEMQEKYSEEIETERRKFEVLREEKAEMEMENEEHVKTLEENHARYLQEQQESFDQKMIVEDQRYKKLEADLEREKQEWDAQHSALLAEHAQVIEQMKQDAEKIQRANRETMDRDIKEKEMAFKQHQETLAQLEQDADREIEELKEMYEQKLTQEKDDKVRLRGQAGIHQKYHHDLAGDMMEMEKDVKDKAEESRKAEERILALMKDKDSNEKEIKERDKTIADKEQRIFDLKKQPPGRNEAQIDPKTADIASMKTQTRAMEDELNDYKRDQVAEEEPRVWSTVSDPVDLLQKKLREDLALIKRFKLDLSDCLETISEPKALKESVTALYRKYVQGGAKRQDLDTDMQKEYNRQRDYLEKSVDSLKRKLEKDSQAHRIDNMRIMQENVSLIREINDLRREINALKHERQAQDDRTSTCEQPRWGAGVGVASRRGGCGIQLVWLVPSIPGPPCGSTGWSHHNQVARSFGATYRKRGGFAPDY